ncbi:c-type cytochrome [Kangiella sediminilitoris]|uniref:Cytochrome c class I n=1 Tax=Kangiella sediminilitoris TaxID=1144748 RepID=A0A1B3BDU7_9GAMM|nr:c-type cytochrome [Kangiella sediminilitoris]AOE50905.1 Cytochrome c class I [Kangiella sediminilitoris]
MRNLYKLITSLLIPVTLIACTPEPQKRDGESIYYRSCFSCHERGHGGAPITGNMEQWQPRLDKGEDVLLDSMVNGYKGMPPKGGCFDCSEKELQMALEFMIKPDDLKQK